MKTIFKTLTSVVIGCAALASTSSHALVVTFGGQAATDGSSLTSDRWGVGLYQNNVVSAPNFFVETFDPSTKSPNPSFPAGLTGNLTNSAVNITVQNGCSFNSFNALGITTTGGGMGIRQGTVGGYAAAPANDTTCFGFTPNNGSSGSVKVDYSGFQGNSNAKVNYLGFYAGSIDTYNSIKFYSSGNTLLQSTGLLADGILTGTEILGVFANLTGNQTNQQTNRYVNFDFAPNEVFSAFEIVTTSVAFEIDNLAVGIVPNSVPEPESLALVGLGLLGLVASRRRKVA